MEMDVREMEQEKKLIYTGGGWSMREYGLRDSHHRPALNPSSSLHAPQHRHLPRHAIAYTLALPPRPNVMALIQPKQQKLRKYSIFCNRDWTSLLC